MTTTTRGTRSLLAAAVLGLVLLLGTAPAGAGSFNTIVVDPAVVAAGDTFTASGPADCEGLTIVVGIPQLEIGNEVDAVDAWETEITIPADTPPGTYLVTAEGAECPYGDATIVVTEADPTTTTAAPTTTIEVADAAVTAPSFTG